LQNPSGIVDPSASLMASLLTGFDYSDATGIDITKRSPFFFKRAIALFLYSVSAANSGPLTLHLKAF
jgi:hypothetical protein